MSYQFPPVLLALILRRGLGEELSGRLLNIQAQLGLDESTAEEKFRSVFWTSALTQALGRSNLRGTVIENFFSSLVRHSRRQSLPLTDLAKRVPPEWARPLREALEKEQAQAARPRAAKEDGQDLSRSEAAAATAPSGIYCENAGMVMLHPFLASYFQAFNLLNAKGNEFAGPETQYKAIYLLHYLATGEWAPPEFELSLPKLLCGLPIDHPLPREITLEPAEIAESSQLLQAVIRHWGALGKTSEDGLREGFLQRTGKLTFEKDQWLLQIERKTIDILLDKLPWSFARIKLPWMKYFLRVEWA